jgi:hypothetical protein
MSGRGCPVCGALLPVNRRGRPAAWCGKPCRQAAYRARQAAARAIEHAARIRAALAAAHADLQRAEAQMAAAYGRAADRAAEPGADDADQVTGGPGWEMPVHDAARRLAVAAARLAELAAAHDRARAEHRAALAVFRRPPAPRPPGDETGPDFVATAVAAAAATQTVSDPDALFDAAEDVVTAFADETLPPDVAAALRPALERLAGAFEDASGADPGPLAAAAAGLSGFLPLAAIRAGEVPPALARLAAVVRA